MAREPRAASTTQWHDALDEGWEREFYEEGPIARDRRAANERAMQGAPARPTPLSSDDARTAQDIQSDSSEALVGGEGPVVGSVGMKGEVQRAGTSQDSVRTVADGTTDAENTVGSPAKIALTTSMASTTGGRPQSSDSGPERVAANTQGGHKQDTTPARWVLELRKKKEQRLRERERLRVAFMRAERLARLRGFVLGRQARQLEEYRVIVGAVLRQRGSARRGLNGITLASLADLQRSNRGLAALPAAVQTPLRPLRATNIVSVLSGKGCAMSMGACVRDSRPRRSDLTGDDGAVFGSPTRDPPSTVNPSADKVTHHAPTGGAASRAVVHGQAPSKNGARQTSAHENSSPSAHAKRLLNKAMRMLEFERPEELLEFVISNVDEWCASQELVAALKRVFRVKDTASVVPALFHALRRDGGLVRAGASDAHAGRSFACLGVTCPQEAAQPRAAAPMEARDSPLDGPVEYADIDCSVFWETTT